jgi:hypothetical protein
VESLSVSCSYEVKDIKGIFDEKSYCCNFKWPQVNVRENVTQVIGKHNHGKKNDDVRGLIAGSRFKKFPAGFNLFFKNLELISCPEVGLESLTNSDLKVFPKLRVIDFANNEIETLEKSVFQDNLNLEKIFLKNNKISLVVYNLLKPLTKLTVVNFLDNPCISIKADKQKEIEDLRHDLNLRCVDYDALIEDKTLPLQLKLDESEAKNVDLGKKIESLEAKNNKSETSNEELRELIQNLKADLEQERTKTEEIEAKEAKWKSEVQSQIEQFELNLLKNSTQELNQKISGIQEAVRILKEYQNSSQTQDNDPTNLMIKDIGMNLATLKLATSERYSEVMSRIDENSSDFNQTLIKHEEILENLKQSDENQNNELLKLKKNPQQVSTETSGQYYLVIGLCILFTITTAVFLIVTISTKFKRRFVTHEYDMSGLTDSHD